MKSAHICKCNAFCLMKIDYILPEKSQFPYLESSIQKSVHLSEKKKKTRDIATLLQGSTFLRRATDLTFITIWANSADDKLMIFFLFSQKTNFDISCKLSSFSGVLGKNKKNISIWHLLKFLPRVLNVKLWGFDTLRRVSVMITKETFGTVGLLSITLTPSENRSSLKDILWPVLSIPNFVMVRWSC